MGTKSKYVFTIVIFLIGCKLYNEFSTPQKTLEVLTKASQEGNMRKFLNGIDLDYFRAMYSSGKLGNKQIEEKRFIEVIMTTPEMQEIIKRLMNLFKGTQFVVLYDKEIGENAKELTLKCISNYENRFSEETAIFLFIKRKGQWKLNIEEIKN
ncbi:MAG: hypothetical protein WC614_07600 [bacterium]